MFQYFFQLFLADLHNQQLRILFLVDIPIKMTSAICEKILIELFKNRIKTKPPNKASGTVNIIINGWINELKVAAITKVGS